MRTETPTLAHQGAGYASARRAVEELEALQQPLEDAYRLAERPGAKSAVSLRLQQLRRDLNDARRAASEERKKAASKQRADFYKKHGPLFADAIASETQRLEPWLAIGAAARAAGVTAEAPPRNIQAAINELCFYATRMKQLGAIDKLPAPLAALLEPRQ